MKERNHPRCIFIEDEEGGSRVIAWSQLTDQQKEQVLKKRANGREDKLGPDKGNGKHQRKKKRRKGRFG